MICFNAIDDDLHAYASSMVKRFRMFAAAPLYGLASFSEKPVQTLIAHRADCFQTELCMFGAGVDVPEHHHPGAMRFMAVRINQADRHTVEIGEHGAAFLSMQRWDSGAPTHIGDNWIGTPCSNTHGERLGD